MAADGSIVIEANIDDKQAQKDLNELNEQIKTLEKSFSNVQKQADSAAKSRDNLYSKFEKENSKYIESQGKLSGLQEAQAPLIAQADQIRSQLEIAKQQVKLFGEQWRAGVTGADREQTAAQEHVKELSQDYESVLQQIEKMDPAILKATNDVDAQRITVDEAERAWSNAKHEARNLNMEAREIERNINSAKEQAGGMEQKLLKSSSASGAMERAMDRMQKSANRFSLRLREVVRSALIFTVISQALASLRSWLGKVIQTNDEARAALARLQGALLTLAQPLLQVVIPAFVTFINVLTQIVSTVAQLFAMLFGTTIEQSKEAASDLEAEASAIEGVGSAAEEAKGSLASFDEINTISTSTGGSGGGGASAGGTSPDFGFEANMDESQLRNILDLIKAIGSALIAWKIGSSLGLGLKQILLLFLAIYSAATFLENLFSAWTGGVTLSNALGMIASALATALFLFLALGKTLGPIAAGISLIVTGLAMLVTGFHDAMGNGWNFENLLLSIAGIIATGLGIAILTGSWIPLLIAGIASLLLAFAVATGHGEELLNGIQTILQGFLDFFTGIFTGDIELAISGVEQIFDGLGTAVGAVFDGMIDTILSFLDWLDEKTGGVLSPLLNFIKGLFSSVFGSVKDTVLNVIDSIKQIFTGLVKFVSGVFTQDWNLAWEGVKDVFRGIWNGIVGILEGAINLIVDGINWVIGKINGLIGEGIISAGLELLGVPGGKIPRLSRMTIPRLAQGTVVPPNREFLAVLGDNKQETEVVSPLSTMKQAVLEALREAGGIGNGTVTVVVNLDGREVARNTVKHINRMTDQAGRSVLKF